MVTEEYARHTFAGDRAAALCDVVEGAWQDYVDVGVHRHRRARATDVWDNMTRRALASNGFGSMPGVTVIEKNDTSVFLVDDGIALKFKKHDRDNRTRNFRTRLQRRIQGVGRFPDMPERDLLTCGYRLDEAEASVEKVLLVRAIGGEIEWVVDLHELARGVIAPATPILPGLPAELAPLPRIVRPAAEGVDDAG